MSGTFICGQRSLCFLSGSFRDASEYLAVHVEANNPSTPFLLSMWGHLTSDPAPILQSLPCAAQSAKLVTWESTTVVEVPGLYLPFLISAFIMAVKSYQLLFSSWDGGRWQTGESNPNLIICFCLQYVSLSHSLDSAGWGKGNASTQPSREPGDTYLTRTLSRLPQCAFSRGSSRGQNEIIHSCTHSPQRCHVITVVRSQRAWAKWFYYGE